MAPKYKQIDKKFTKAPPPCHFAQRSNKEIEQCTFKYVNNYLNTNIYSSLETSGGKRSNLYLNVVHFFNTRVNWISVAA